MEIEHVVRIWCQDNAGIADDVLAVLDSWYEQGIVILQDFLQIAYDEIIRRWQLVYEWLEAHIDLTTGIQLYRASIFNLEAYGVNLTVCKNGGVCIVISLIIAYVIYQLSIPKMTFMEKKLAAFASCRKALSAEIKQLNCNPILLRLAFSDVQTYDKNISDWRLAGGANGSIRFDYVLNQPVNTGLSKAIDILKIFKSKYPSISWADLIQMGGALAVELSGGPVIDMKYGRVDAPPMNQSSNELHSHQYTGKSSIAARLQKRSMEYMFNCPCALPPYSNGASSPEIHIRNVFYRMGFTNRDIVALMGAHTLGRAFKDRSGVCPYSSGEQGSTPYTRQSSIAKASGESGIGMPGGCSWTKNWLTFDNSYYERIVTQINTLDTSHHDPVGLPSLNDGVKRDSYLLWLPTDQALYDSPEFYTYFLKYSKDQSTFFHDYAIAHKKMSELGCKFQPPEGITLHTL